MVPKSINIISFILLVIFWINFFLKKHKIRGKKQNSLALKNDKNIPTTIVFHLLRTSTQEN
jgi:hypothetical protein